MVRKTLYYETSNSLAHHGIKGQKWGVRRFQNEDGTLTAKGKKRYVDTSDIRKEYDAAKDSYKKAKSKYEYDYDTALSNSYKHPISQFNKKSKNYEKVDKAYDKAWASAAKLDNARERYDQAKQARKDALKDNLKTVRADKSTLEKVLYKGGYDKKVAKLITDTDMSLDEAKIRTKREAMRNTVLVTAAVAAIGVYTLKKTRG